VAAAGTLGVFAWAQNRLFAFFSFCLGATAAVLAASDIHDPGNITSHVNDRLATIDWGLYVTVIGSISLMLASTALSLKRTRHA